MGCGGSQEKYVDDSVFSKHLRNRAICQDSWTKILSGEYKGFQDAKAKDKHLSPGRFFFDAFYGSLNKISPITREYFAKHSVITQSRSLLFMVAHILRLKGHPAEKEDLEEIARKHAVYLGVSHVHYKPVGKALQNAVQIVLADEATEEINEAWEGMWEYITDAMVPVAKENNKPVVIIVGGGYAACNVAQQLDEHVPGVRVVMISRTDYFFHCIGSVRGIADPDWVNNCMVPYTNLMRNGGTVIHGEVTRCIPPYTRTKEEPNKKKMLAPGVVIAGRRTPLHYNFLVIATGSSYAFPSKLPLANRKDVVKSYYSIFDELKMNPTAKVLCVGGGAVACEIVGELKSGFPNADVTILHRYPLLLGNNYTQEMREGTTTAMKNLGVTMKVGNGVKNAAMLAEDVKKLNLFFKNQTLQDDDGHEYYGDLVLWCTGCLTNTGSLTQDFSHVLKNDRLETEPSMLVKGYHNVFALGDISGIDPRKLGKCASAQAPIVVENIQRLIADQMKTPTSIRSGKFSFDLNDMTNEEVAMPEIKLPPLVEYDNTRKYAAVIAMGPGEGVGWSEDGKLLNFKTNKMVQGKSHSFNLPYIWNTLLKQDYENRHNATFNNVTEGDQDDESIEELMAAMNITKVEALGLLQNGYQAVDKSGHDKRT